MQRPTSVTVFAILNIIWAAIGVISLGFAVANWTGVYEPPTADNPVLKLMESNHAYRLFTHISTAVGAVATIVLLAAAIGLLQLKPWARIATIGYGCYTILITLLATVMNELLIFGPLREQTAGSSGPEHIAATAGSVMVVVMAALVMAYCGLMILMLSRRGVIEAFVGDVDEELADEPWHASSANDS